MLVKATAKNVNEVVRELPDANLVRDLKICGQFILNLFTRSLTVGVPLLGQQYKRLLLPEKKGLDHFRRIKPLDCGDTGIVHLVELKGTGELFAMKAMEKSVMLNRNKVHRVCIEREVIAFLDHPFLLYMLHIFHDIYSYM